MTIALDPKLLTYLRRVQGYLSLEENRKTRKKMKPKRQLLAGEARRHVIQQVMDVLRDWRASPFEYEGSTRAGLRAGLCVRGHGWAAADTEAAALIDEGLRLMGARRPSWAQGQREYVIAEDECNWCGLMLPGEDREAGRQRRFCSPSCARSAILHRETEWRRRDVGAFNSAASILRQAKMPQRVCAHCERTYRPLATKPDQTFCSENCKWQAMRKHPDRTCKHCEGKFQPKEAEQVYCGRPCYVAATGKPRFIRECTECQQEFMPRKATAERCSIACRNAYIVRTRKARNPMGIQPVRPRDLQKIFTLEIFDSWFQKAA